MSQKENPNDLLHQSRQNHFERDDQIYNYIIQ